MSERKRATGLMDEPPLLVYPSLAAALGIHTAIVLQQLHFLLNSQSISKNEYVFIDGRWWVYNTYQEWQEGYFSWLSTSTLKNIFLSLERDGLVLTKQSVKNKSDRRKWYTIDYEAWEKFCLTIGQKVSDEPSDKNSPMVGQKVSDGYSEITSKNTETTAEDSAAVASGALPEPDYQKRPQLYSKKPLPQEEYSALGLRDQQTALFAAICWHVLRNATSGEEAWKLRTAKTRTLTDKFLQSFKEIDGITPELIAATFDLYHKHNPFADQLRDAALAAEYVREYQRTGTLACAKPRPARDANGNGAKPPAGERQKYDDSRVVTNAPPPGWTPTFRKTS